MSQDWIARTNGVTERWSCSWTENNKQIYVNLKNVKWLWIGMKTSSVDPKDHGVFGELEMIVDPELKIDERLLGIPENTHDDRPAPVYHNGSIWTEDTGTNNQPLTMNGITYPKGIGGKPPLNTTEYSYLVYNLEEVFSAANIDPRQARKTAVEQGVIFRETWTGIAGSNISDLTSHPDYPHKPNNISTHTLFEAPTNTGEHYGARMYGYLVAPQTGNYYFWIASDDTSELWLSSDENPANKQRIAYVPEYTQSREWNKYAEQKSAAIFLEAGRVYFIEALHKEGEQDDNLAVGWQLPNGIEEKPIPGNRFQQAYSPAVYLYGYGGHQDGSGSVDLDIKTCNSILQPSQADWYNNWNGVTQKWHCSYEENNKRIYLNLENTKWLFLGMKTGSPDPNDHGVFAELKFAVENEKPHVDYRLGIAATPSPDTTIEAADKTASPWADNLSTSGSPIQMNNVVYDTGIGGKPPLAVSEFSWVLYNLKDALEQRNVAGKAIRLTGFGGHQDGSGSVDLYIKTSCCTSCPSANEWMATGNGVQQQWFCGYTENNKEIYVDLTQVKWVWLGMRTGSPDANDHGVFGDLKITVALDERDYKTYLFSGDQYFRYNHARFIDPIVSVDPFYLEESYPKVIKDNWTNLEELGEVPESMSDAIRAAFMGIDNKPWLFSDSLHKNLYRADAPAPINFKWGVVDNNFQRFGATIDAIIHIPGTTPKAYLFSGNEYVRYTGNDTLHCDEGYPRLISDWKDAEGVTQGFPIDYRNNGLCAALNGNDGKQYYFYAGTFVTSDNYYQKRTLVSDWHTQVNPAINFDDVTMALTTPSAAYLFCREYFIKYAGTINPGNSAFQPVSGYPKVVADDWSAEGTGIDLSLYDPRKKTAMGNFQEGSSVIPYLFVGDSHMRPDVATPVPVFNRLKFGKRPNTIQDENRVDAAVTTQICGAFVTYLFSGDQYVRYTHAKTSRIKDYRYVDAGYPKLLADGWAEEHCDINLKTLNPRPEGYALLKDVDDRIYHFDDTEFTVSDGVLPTPPTISDEWGLVLNYIQMDNLVDAAFVYPGGGSTYTYLFRRNQLFRYLSDDSSPLTDYGYVDEGYPKIMTAEKWAMFESHLAGLKWPFSVQAGTGDEGEEGIHAALYRDGALYIFDRYNIDTDNNIETDPVPINGYVDVLSTTEVAPSLNNNWGIVNNLIQDTGLVDAAVVVNDGVYRYTYLFSGIQFVKYTHRLDGSLCEYKHIDISYPRTIAGKFHQEFTVLSGAFPDTIQMNAAFSEVDDTQVSFFMKTVDAPTQCTWLKMALDTASLPGFDIVDDAQDVKLKWGYVYNRFDGDVLTWKTDALPDPSPPRPEKENGSVLGAVSLADGRLAIFVDDQFAIYSNGVRTDETGLLPYVDESFPRRIYGSTPVVPSDEVYRGDAIDIKGNYWGLQELVPIYNVDGTLNHLESVQAVFTLCNRTFFFMNRYVNEDTNLPLALHYFRYSDPKVKRFDSDFPRLVENMWKIQPDLSVNQLEPFWQMKDLSRAFREKENDILSYLQTDFALGTPTEIAAQKSALAKITGWLPAEVEYIANSLLTNHSDKDLQNLLLLFAIKEYYDFAVSLNSLPQSLHTDIATAIFGTLPSSPDISDLTTYLDNYRNAETLLYQLLKSSLPAATWADLSGEYQNLKNVIKRNAYVPLLMSILTDKGVVDMDNPRDLYQYLFIDVEMGQESVTSRIKEALECMQLYYHRTLLQIEDDANARDGLYGDLKDWWFWMKNYRVWEANRKVFLYPENYLRPELRRDKSEAFKKLEEALKQNDLDEVSIENSYRDYMDSYLEVSTLDVVGGYVYTDGDNTDAQTHEDPTIEEDGKIIMFGHTRTEPLKYFYRKGVSLVEVSEVDDSLEYGRTVIDWEPWKEIKVSINAKKVFPVYAFNRVFVFWIENEVVDISDPEKQHMKVKKVEPRIYYSFLKMNDEWIQPQTLVNVFDVSDSKHLFNVVVIDKEDEKNEQTTDEIFYQEMQRFRDASLVVETEFLKLSYEGQEQIIVKYQMDYTYNEVFRSVERFYQAFHPHFFKYFLEPKIKKFNATYEKAWLIDTKLYHEETNNPSYLGISDAKFETDNYFIDENARKSFHWKTNYNSTTYPPWFSVTMKGGSFLIKPEKLPVMTSDKLAESFKELTSVSNFELCPATSVSAAMNAALDEKDYLFSNNQYYRSSDSFAQSTLLRDTFGKKPNLLGNSVYSIVATSISPAPPVDSVATYARYIYFFVKIGSNSIQYFRYPFKKSDAEIIDYQQEDSVDLEMSYIAENDLEETVFPGYEEYTDSAESFFQNEMTGVFVFPRLIVDTNTNTTTVVYDYYLFSKTHYCKMTSSALINMVTAAVSLTDSTLLTAVFIQGEYACMIFGNEYVKFDLNSGSGGFIVHSLDELIGTVSSDFDAVSAAFTGDNDVTYFFNNQLCRFHNGTDWQNESRVVKWGNRCWLNQTGKGSSVDAALTHDGKTWLFSRDQFITYTGTPSSGYDYTGNSYSPQKICDSAEFGALRSLFETSGTIDSTGAALNGVDALIDTMFFSQKIGEFTDGSNTRQLYVFSKGYYCCYDYTAGEFKQSANHMPKRIADSLGNLPVEMSRYIDAAVNFPVVNPDGTSDERLLLFTNIDEGANSICRVMEYNSAEKIAGSGDNTYLFPYEFNRAKFEIIRLTSHTANVLSQTLFAQGIDGLLKCESQEIRELPVFSDLAVVDGVDRSDIIRVKADKIFTDRLPTSEKTLDFESANKEYYWEIFFHVPFLIAQELNTQQRFEDARQWFEYIFDPTDPRDLDALGLTTQEYEEKQKYKWWRFIEFWRNAQKDIFEDYIDRAQIKRYKDDPFDPHTIASIREIAYQKATVMAYIDNLLDWGDQLFGQYTRESINEARMLYVLAYDILGKRPENLGEQKIPESASYEELINFNEVTKSGDYTHHSEFLIELENGAPAGIPDPPPHVDTIVRNNLYFTIPENDVFTRYWDRVEDRLYKIRATLNIDGVKQALPLFQPPIDPFLLISAMASGLNLDAVLADLAVNAPHYRFTFMLSKAKELASRLTQLGSTMLSTLEKKDAEELSLLRNSHEKNILAMNLSIKEDQLNERKESLNALKVTLKSANARKSHYTAIINRGLNAFEKSQLVNLSIGQTYQMMSQVFGVAQSVTAGVPQAGSPFSLNWGGIQLSNIAGGLSGAFGAQAGFYNFLANLSSILGGHERRSEDWTLQKQLATFDVEQTNLQIKAAELQIKIANKEIQIQKKLIRQNESIDDFMQSKFTSKELYQWMTGKLATVYFQTYKLALDYAKAAQKAFQYELGILEADVNYIKGAYWDSLKKGLLSGETLMFDLDRLEKAYTDKNGRRFELTKTVSLFGIDPIQLVKLKTEHACEFSLTHKLYDEDFPGHYCRQIKSVSITFPAVVGPYQSINATLTQLSHETLLTADEKALLDPGHSAIRRDWRANQQIALSRGVNDSGLFELRFQDERYLPFEGTGAVSTWRLEFEGLDGLVDISTLSDVLITVNYTALQGGDKFAKKVKSMYRAEQEKALIINIAQSFPTEWHEFVTRNIAAQDDDELDPANLTISIPKEMLYNPRTCTRALLFIEPKTNGTSVDGEMIMTINEPSDSTGILLSNLVVSDEIGVSLRKGAVITLSPGELDFENIRNIGLVLGYTCKYEFNK